MIVRKLDMKDPEALARWDALAESNGRPYQSSAWIGVLASVYGFTPHYLYGEQEGETVSLFPLFLVRGPFGGWEAVSLPHVEAAGVLGTGEFRLYLDFLSAEPRARELSILQFAQPLGDFPAQENEVIFVKALPGEPEGIIPSLPSATARNTMRQALRTPYRTVAGNDEALLATFYARYLEKMREFGTPPHRPGFFRALSREFGGRCAVIALKDPSGEWVAASLVVGTGATLLCVALLASAARLRQKTGYALSYQVMDYAVREGYSSLILGRSEKDSGTYGYKKSLGGIPVPLYRYRFCATPDGYRPRAASSAKEKYRNIAQVWSRLPALATDHIGPVVRKWLY